MSEEVSVLRRVRWALDDAILMTWRNLMHYLRVPMLLFYAVIQPIMFTVLFVFVFGGAIDTRGPYVNYLLPGIIVQTVIFSSLMGAINIATDMEKGIMDRFRSLPMATGTVLAGRTLSDTARNAAAVLVMVLVGYAVGYRFEGTFAGALVAFALILVVGFAFSWIAAAIGLSVRNPQAAEMAAFTWSFPLVFASSIFVPTDTMPGWLEAFAEANPISLAANAVRELSTGVDPGNDLWLTVLWCVGIVALFRPLAVWRFRRLA